MLGRSEYPGEAEHTRGGDLLVPTQQFMQAVFEAGARTVTGLVGLEPISEEPQVVYVPYQEQQPLPYRLETPLESLPELPHTPVDSITSTESVPAVSSDTAAASSESAAGAASEEA